MKKNVQTLASHHDVFVKSKQIILRQWISYDTPKKIFQLHKINREYFLKKYASGVFDYFMGVISGEVEIGNCPVMQGFLTYLRKREISADELFEICSHFRRSMIDFSYDAELNSKELFDEISYIFDKNFKGILKFYTDSIFQKLVDARQEAIRASQAKEYFLSNMSHEIRTPLNAILGFVNLLLSDDISKKHRNYLDIIYNSGENLLSIINDILDFSKLRSGEFAIEEKVFSLHEDLSHTMELFVASANAKDITIISFIDPKIPIELYGDSLRIKQILSNFLSNAIKFTSNNGIIKVEAHYVNDILKISVSDNGIGISKYDIDKVFIAFSQAQYNIDTSKGGTGLGLSICYQLAQKMKGSVEVVSELDKGSTFIFNVPIKVHTKECKVFEDIDKFKKLKMALYSKEKKITSKKESFLKYAKIFNMNIEIVDTLQGEFDVCIFVHEDIESELQNYILNSDKKFIALMSKEYDKYESYKHIKSVCFPLYCSKIHRVFDELFNPIKDEEYIKDVFLRYKGHLLVAEDNEANQELIKILLNKYGLSFDLVENGLEALELYKTNKYDLILMDEQMPVMNGNESVKKIIEYEETKGLKHTPVSALTANVIKGAKERGLISGFDAFLGKPIVIKELERVFSSYLIVDKDKKINKERIFGLDTSKLTQELMLTEEELLMLLKLFIKKMLKVIPKLSEAIQKQDYKDIALIAHSIKGASSNFRIQILQDISSEMEKMAKNRNVSYDYEENLKSLKNKISSIKIV